MSTNNDYGPELMFYPFHRFMFGRVFQEEWATKTAIFTGRLVSKGYQDILDQYLLVSTTALEYEHV